MINSSKARERHPDACFLRDVPAETLEALFSVGNARAQSKAAMAGSNPRRIPTQNGNGAISAGGGSAAGKRAMTSSHSPSRSDRGRFDGGGSGSVSNGHRRTPSTGVVRRRLTPEVLTHARHLAADVQRVRRKGGEIEINREKRWLYVQRILPVWICFASSRCGCPSVLFL